MMRLALLAAAAPACSALSAPLAALRHIPPTAPRALPARRAPLVRFSEAAGHPEGATKVVQISDGVIEEVDECTICEPTQCGTMPQWLYTLAELQERGAGSVLLILATCVSLALANIGATSGWWLGLWATPVGPPIGGHALSLRGWVNEGLMAIFFFVVGLEIKQELRFGALASLRKAVLPCLAAVGGMVTPMAVYVGAQLLLGGGSMAALAVPMATDIAFAMAIYGFFRARMPPSASAFLLTLATVDDVGAILVLATCFAHDVSLKFLGLAGAITAGLMGACRSKVADLKVYAAGAGALWWALLRSGVNSDIAGVVAALCVSTRVYTCAPDGHTERLTERAITRLAPLATFAIMPIFALANTAVRLGGLGGPAAAAGAAPAIGVAAGLLLGKPLGIVAFTWLAVRSGVAAMPSGMRPIHLGIVGVLGAIGFTMCLLLTEVAVPAVATQTLPKLAVLISSGLAAAVASVAMSRLPLRSGADDKAGDAPRPKAA